VAQIEKFLAAFDSGCKIIFSNEWCEADFFGFMGFIFLFFCLGFSLLLIFKLVKVDNLGNWRLSLFSYNNQI